MNASALASVGGVAPPSEEAKFHHCASRCVGNGCAECFDNGHRRSVAVWKGDQLLLLSGSVHIDGEIVCAECADAIKAIKAPTSTRKRRTRKRRTRKRRTRKRRTHKADPMATCDPFDDPMVIS